MTPRSDRRQQYRPSRYRMRRSGQLLKSREQSQADPSSALACRNIRPMTSQINKLENVLREYVCGEAEVESL
jgi:hypothetical protein